MSFPNKKFVTIEEFYSMRKETDSLLEYIGGDVYMSPPPSIQHQHVSRRLFVEISTFLKEKECEVFSSPFDIKLFRKDIDIKDTKIVIPDLSIICDKRGLMETQYVGVPSDISVIVEILTPSNQQYVFATKMNVYAQYGVKEYWIINPMLHVVQIYILGEDKQYRQMSVLRKKGTAYSEVLQGFQIEIEELFLS